MEVLTQQYLLQEYLLDQGISQALFGEKFEPPKSVRQISQLINDGYLVGHIDGELHLYNPNTTIRL